MIHSTKCSGTEHKRKIHKREITYCMKCGLFEVKTQPCKHKFVPILFEIKGGRHQVRRACEYCREVDSNILSFKGFDIEKLPKENLDKHRAYTYEMYQELHSLMSKLQEIREGFLKNKNRDYYEYLRSPEWKRKRDRVHERDNHTCQICGHRSEDTHHLTYEHVYDEFLFELVSLCHSCHQKYY